eukprot:TRINITY_DN0_c0_g1_i1.p1 TRINITY_DN0_c0_g1~~TRINITY_DN0_c0_g1_i1.p1  ORF type:complete len:673 (-),score=149.02 TRINITY_DN0_c0_g1_i1:52-2070(-)
MFLLLCAFFILGFSFEVKNLAGKPSEFIHHRIPDPTKVLQLERSLSKSIWFEQQEENVIFTDGHVIYTTPIPIDGGSDVVLTFASPVASDVVPELKDSDGVVVPLTLEKDFFHVGDSTVDRVPAYTYLLKNPKAGLYTFTLSAKASLTKQQFDEVVANPYPDAVVALVSNDAIEIASHLQSYFVRTGAKLGLESTIIDAGVHFTQQPSAHNVVISSASLHVTNPHGQTVVVPMNDDGVDADLIAGDGNYTGAMTLESSGTYFFEAKIEGNYVDSGSLLETPFQRSTQHLIEVSPISDLELSGKGRATILDDKRTALHFGVLNDEKVPRDYQLRAYAEVYGKDSNGQLKAACWIGGLVTLDKNHEFKLVLDNRWFQAEGLSLPITVRNLYISDVKTSFPLAQITKDIVVDAQRSLASYFKPDSQLSLTPEVMKEMRNGLKPLSRTNTTAQASDISLVLLPGYCANINPWGRNTDHFTNGFFPVQYGNYANDEYAKLIIGQIEAKGITRFGIIAHSQGGMISTHIHNYYWTGLEDAQGERLIQTMGTPFQGTSASGSMANLAKVFGVACGSNSDLSRDGATNWLSGISMETRQDVYSYSSTYSSGSYLGDYCSLPMNLILQWPNDGVTEADFAPLPGGNFLGNTEEECHTTEMAYAPQFDNETRNKLMNSLAAR